MKKFVSIIFCLLAGICIFVSCNMGGGDSSNAPKLSPSLVVGYKSIEPYNSEGFPISENQVNADISINDSSAKPFHLLITSNGEKVAEATKGDEFAFKVLNKNSQYDDNGTYETQVGYWAREINKEFGFSEGKVNKNDDSGIEIKWGGNHYTEAKISKLLTTAQEYENMGAYGSNEAWDTSTEYYQKKTLLTELKNLYDAKSLSEAVNAVSSGLMPLYALDMSSYRFDSTSKKYTKQATVGTSQVTLKATFDENGKIRILEIGDETRIDFSYGGEVPLAPPLPTSGANTNSKSYTKSTVEPAKFKTWNTFANQDYAKIDSTSLGSSNVKMFITKYNDTSRKTSTKIEMYRRVTQNLSGTDGGSRATGDLVSASKACGLWWDENNQIQAGVGIIGEVDEGNDGSQTILKNIWDVVSLGQKDYEKDENNVPLLIKKSARKSYTLKTDDTIEKWRKLWRQSTVESGIVGELYTNPTITTYSDARIAGDNILKIEDNKSQDKEYALGREGLAKSNLENGTLYNNKLKEDRSGYTKVDSYYFIRRIYENSNGSRGKWKDAIIKKVTKEDNSLATKWTDGNDKLLTESEANTKISGYENGNYIIIYDLQVSYDEGFENVLMWMSDRDTYFEGQACCNGVFRGDIKNFCGDWKADVSFKISDMWSLCKNIEAPSGPNNIPTSITNWSELSSDFVNIDNYEYKDGWYVFKSQDFSDKNPPELKLAFDQEGCLREVQHRANDEHTTSWDMVITYGEAVPNWFPRPHNLRYMLEVQ